MRSGVRHRCHRANGGRSRRWNRLPGFYQSRWCIDCGNCAELCAQNAIFPADDLPPEKAHFAEKNKAYFN